MFLRQVSFNKPSTKPANWTKKQLDAYCSDVWQKHPLQNIQSPKFSSLTSLFSGKDTTNPPSSCSHCYMATAAQFKPKTSHHTASCAGRSLVSSEQNIIQEVWEVFQKVVCSSTLEICNHGRYLFVITIKGLTVKICIWNAAFQCDKGRQIIKQSHHQTINLQICWLLLSDCCQDKLVFMVTHTKPVQQNRRQNPNCAHKEFPFNLSSFLFSAIHDNSGRETSLTNTVFLLSEHWNQLLPVQDLQNIWGLKLSWSRKKKSR